MKAIVLTNAYVDEHEQQLLKDTNIFKIALNFHAEHLKPDLRIATDYGMANGMIACFSQKVVTIRDYFQHERNIYRGQITFKGSTIVACIEYLIFEKFDEILLIADNSVHQEWFKDRIKKEIDLIMNQKRGVKIYQYRNGNFNLPEMSIQEFTKERGN